MQGLVSAFAFAADLFNPNRSTLQQVLHRQKLEAGSRQKWKQKKQPKKKQLQQQSFRETLASRRQKTFDDGVSKSLKNWELLPSDSLVWFAVAEQRAADMIALTKRSAAKVRATCDVEHLAELSQLIVQLADQEMENITECRRLLQSAQLLGGYRFQGSTREVWGFQDGSDIDLVLSMRRQRDFDVTNIVPGFCLLWRTSTVVKIWQQQGVLELFKPGRRFTDASATSEVLSPGKYRRHFSQWRMDSSKKMMDAGKLDAASAGPIHEHGPAVTHRHCFLVDGKEERRELDFVCTVRLKSRPWLLQEWEQRQRRSSFGLSKRLARARVHVVPIGAYAGATVQRSHTWRYSYNELECRLVDEFSPAQGAAYALLKKVCHQYLKPAAGFKSYHAKTCYFWLLAQPQDADSAGPSVLEAVHTTVEMMLQCAAAGYMPNYFMPNENVLRETVRPGQVPLDELAAYLAGFATAGKRITDLTVRRLSCFVEQLKANMASAPPPQPDWSGCVCRFNDVAKRPLDEAECARCDQLNLYALHKPESLLVRLMVRLPVVGGGVAA